MIRDRRRSVRDLRQVNRPTGGCLVSDTHHPRGARRRRRHPRDRRGGRRDRADFLKRGGVAGAGFVAGGVLFNGLVSPAEAAISTHQQVEGERRQDRQLRAHPRVPRGRVLQAGGRHRRDHAARGAARSPPSSAATRPTHVEGAARASSGSKAVKKPTFDFGNTVTEPGQVQADGAGARGHGRRGLRRPGPEHAAAPARQGRPVDPLGRGAPRGVDPLHQLGGGRRHRRGATCRRRRRSTRR